LEAGAKGCYNECGWKMKNWNGNPRGARDKYTNETVGMDAVPLPAAELGIENFLSRRR
jgi:hypothetical protein